jgi:hypothetical protein
MWRLPLLEMGSELIEILQKYVVINIITAILPYFALELLSSTIATCMLCINCNSGTTNKIKKSYVFSLFQLFYLSYIIDIQFLLYM